MMERWADLTGDDIAARAGDAVVLLPLAAIEAHGPHLPVGTDARIADGLLDATAALVDASIDVLRLPILWLGVSPEHAGHGGTLSQPASSWIETVLTVLGGLAAQGVRKVVLFATHGGNIAPSRTAAMEARHRTGMLVVAVHWQEFGWPVALEQASSSGLPSSRDARRDVHGGWVETSIMQAIDATAVAKTPPGPAHRSPPAKALFPEGPLHWGWHARDLGGGGYIGAPDQADPDTGRMIIDHVAERFAALLAELAHAQWDGAQTS